MCFWIYLIYVKSLLLFCFFFYWAFLKTVSKVYSIESLLYLLFYFCYTYNHFRPPRRSCQCHIVQRWLLSEAGDAWKYFTLRLSDTQPFLRLMRVILFSFKKIYYYFLAGYFKKKKKGRKEKKWLRNTGAGVFTLSVWATQIIWSLMKEMYCMSLTGRFWSCFERMNKV